MSRNPIMIDLFSGAGGLSEGLRQANFESIYANEIKSQYLKTYAHNHKNTEVDPKGYKIDNTICYPEIIGNTKR
jgi:site-specific DNA-cytosine methylase